MTEWVKKSGNCVEVRRPIFDYSLLSNIFVDLHDRVLMFQQWVHKGQNTLTEMYSVLKAEVPITESTSFNKELMQSLLLSDRLYVAGQALSHCVNFTVR